MPDVTRAQIGARGEQAAAAFLHNLGYRIVARNYLCAHGEIDIIALDDETVVFAEVRTRTHADDAYPEDTIGTEKRRRLTRAAKMFVSQRRLHDRACRFDVVAVVLAEAGLPDIEHFINAFGTSGKQKR